MESARANGSRAKPDRLQGSALQLREPAGESQDPAARRYGQSPRARWTNHARVASDEVKQAQARLIGPVQILDDQKDTGGTAARSRASTTSSNGRVWAVSSMPRTPGAVGHLALLVMPARHSGHEL